MANPRPGSRRYKGPVHEAVRNALSSIGVQTGKTAPKRGPSLPEQLATNRTNFAADRARLNAWKAKTRAPKNLVGETYDLFSGGNKTGVNVRSVTKPKPKPKAPKSKAKAKR